MYIMLIVVIINFYIRTYVDILNCMMNDQNCSQVCVEVEGSFNCSCFPGYELEQDRVLCKGSQILTYKYVHMYTCIHTKKYKVNRDQSLSTTNRSK